MSKTNFRIQTVRFLAAFSFVVFFSACGDDNKPSNNGGEESLVKQVNRVDDLGGCNKNKFGEIIYVAETDSLYECTGSGWVATDSSALENLVAESSSSDSDDPSGSKSSSSIKVDSSDVADVKVVKVDSITLKGFAQKGPFASGSAVTVYGLDSLLEKTKTKFTGKVAGDSGAFKVANIVLPSQFALVEVSGFFKSEISGKNTTGTKTTLSAIVDLSEGKSVKANVNLFTTLEFARVKHLVAKEGFNVPAAKKRASAELLAIFGAKADDDMTATSISLMDTTVAGEALLTASVMLVGDLSASKFGARLADANDLFAEKGAFADEELLASVADWASKVDSTDNFESIRKNVKEMKLLAVVPDFESFLYKFWTEEYGLGDCSDSLEETIKKNENKKSDNYGIGYACTSKRWHKSTALDTDLGLCTAKREGNFEERKLEKNSEYYVCRSGTWNKITETQFELKECTEKRENEYVATKSGEYFVCSEKQWMELDSISYELKLCTEARNQELAKTKKAGYFVCEWDGKNGEWRKASDVESEHGVCGTGETDSTIVQVSDVDFACIAGTWVEIDALTAELGFCNSKKDGDIEKTKDGAYFECADNAWEESDEVSFKLGFRCSEEREGQMHMTGDSTFWQCVGGAWNSISKAEFVTKKFCDKNIDSTFVNGYACVHNSEGYYWREQSAAEKANNAFCTRRNMDSLKVQNGYTCLIKDKTLKWRDATEAELATGKICNVKTSESIGENVVKGYVCGYDSSGYSSGKNGYHWRPATTVEIAVGRVCVYSLENKIEGEWTCLYRSGTGYFWRSASAGEMATGKICKRESDTEILNGYVCERYYSSDSLDWRPLNSVEKETGLVCGTRYGGNGEGVAIKKDNVLYANKFVCDRTENCITDKIGDYCWRNATTAEKATGQVCNSKLDYVMDSTYTYVCEKSTSQDYQWRSATQSEKTAKAPCIGLKYKLFSWQKNGFFAKPYRCVDTLAHTWNVWTYDTIIDARHKENGEAQSYRILDARLNTKAYSEYTIMVDNFNFHGDGAGSHGSAWWCYNSTGSASNSSDCETYGALYHWTAPVNRGTSYLNDKANIVDPEQGICPSGWHVPSETEMKKLVFSKEYGTLAGSVYGTYVYTEKKFESTPCWWTTQQHKPSSEANTVNAYSCTPASDGTLSCSSRDKDDGCYLRCIKD